MQRHNAIVRVFLDEARAGALTVKHENVLQLGLDQTYKADLVLMEPIPGFTALPTALDATVSNPFAQSLVRKAAATPLAAAEDGNARKKAENDARLLKAGFSFIPLAFEATGGHAPEVETVVHYLAERKAAVTGLPFSQLTALIWQRLAVTLQHNNALMILERMPLQEQ